MIRSFLVSSLLFLIKSYQLLLGPFLGKNCRFYPSCSVYAAFAIKKHGPFKGSIMALHRILRCNSMNKNWGMDDP